MCKDLFFNPYVCLECSKNYCFDCVYKTEKKEDTYNQCLSKCKTINYEPNLDLVFQLNEEIFRCECGEKMNYDAFVDHKHEKAQ